jgi:transcriptional regulator with XRE-family HTH domain
MGMSKQSSLQVKVGRTISRLRKERGFSQESFSDFVGVHRTYMGSLERGEKNMGLRTLERISKSLKMSPGDLLNESEREK